MISVFEYCEKKWSKQLVKSREDVLKKFQLLTLPHDLDQLKKADKNFTIVLQNQGSISSALKIHQMGFKHSINLTDPDLDREILLSILLELNPMSLINHKVPFYFHDLNSVLNHADNDDNHLSIKIEHPDQISEVLDQINLKVQSCQFRSALQETICFAADELMTNGFNAYPQGVQRNILFQAGFNNKFCNLSCTDFAGQLDRDDFLNKLLSEFSTTKIEPLIQHKNAGFGLRSLIHNSAGFYSFCEPNKRTVISCRIHNESPKKLNSQLTHLHI
jgi:hypothetical protein